MPIILNNKSITKINDTFPSPGVEIETFKTSSIRDGDTVVNVPVVPVPHVVSSVSSETIDANYKYMAFKHSGGSEDQTEYSVTFNADTECDILLVGGGGGGGNAESGSSTSGGGGGAGGLIFLQNLTIPADTYQIKVGKGADNINDSESRGNNGYNSSFSYLETEAIGGGGGGTRDVSTRNLNIYRGGNGGSGGGSVYAESGHPEGGLGTQTDILKADGTTVIISNYRQGYDGGDNQVNDIPYSGGGGGAGGEGNNSSGSNDGDGGIGRSGEGSIDFKTLFGITDTSIGEHHTDGKVYFAGGGGNGERGGNISSGGLGGGGDGLASTGSQNGLNNTGGGGAGGNSSLNITPGAGGSGIVIIRYKVISMQPQTLTHYTAERMYPPTRDLTSASHVISGQPYGNGVYVTNQSTIWNGYAGYTAFNTSSTIGYSGATGQYSGGNYVGSNEDIETGYTGDYITIELPYAITLTRYGFLKRVDAATLNRSPGIYKIYGSNDGITWIVLVNKITNINSEYTTSHEYFENVNVSETYKHYAVVVNQLNGSDTMLNFDEWYIYGKEYLYDEPDYKLLTFTYDSANDVSGQTPYTLTFDNPTECDILIVGGGGGGGANRAGGGGAGACIVYPNFTMNGNYKIKVGNGGLGGIPDLSSGINGYDSDITNYDESSIIFRAKGGGYGSSINIPNVPGPGGCGGGSRSQSIQLGGITVDSNIVNKIQTGPNITSTYAVYGNIGGRNSTPYTGSQNDMDGAGGGGIGEGGSTTGNLVPVDSQYIANNPGKGGDGLHTSTINNINYNFKNYFNIGVLEDDGYYYIGGGGGGGDNYVGVGGNGGRGGGGNGGDSGGLISGNGINNTGSGGGGGAGVSNNNGGNGGSGIVIIRYKQQYNQVPYNAQWTYSSTDPTVHHYGNVGIGTIASSTKSLNVRGDVSVTGDYYKNNEVFGKWFKNNNDIYRGGNVGIGTSNPRYNLDVMGNVYASEGGISGNGSTSWITTSDSRIKENIVRASYKECYEIFKKINLYRYNYNGEYIDTNDKNQLGFIAQEVKTYLPDSVQERKMKFKNDVYIDDTLTLNVTEINYVMFGAFKYLMGELEIIKKHLPEPIVQDTVVDTNTDTIEDTTLETNTDTIEDTVADTTIETNTDTIEDTTLETNTNTIEDTVADTTIETNTDTIEDTT